MIILLLTYALGLNAARAAALVDCAPDLSLDFENNQIEAEGTLAAMGEALAGALQNGGALEGRNLDLYRQAVDVQLGQVVRFRERHPGTFQCVTAVGRMIDSGRFDGAIQEFKAEANRLKVTH